MQLLKNNIVPKSSHLTTRMHSSRMRTGHSLTVCRSLLLWGVNLVPGGWVSVQGGLCPGWSLSRVVSVQVVSVQVGLCPGWSLSRVFRLVSVQGGLCPGGLCPGVSAQGGLYPKGSLSERLPGHRPPYSKERVECFLDVNFFLCVIFTFLHRYFSPF